jgi:predicted nuclease with TOPRIM domain
MLRINRRNFWALCVVIPILFSEWVGRAGNGAGESTSPTDVHEVVTGAMEEFKKLQNDLRRMEEREKLRNERSKKMGKALTENNKKMDQELRLLSTALRRLNDQHVQLKQKFTHELSHSRSAKSALSYLDHFKMLFGSK